MFAIKIIKSKHQTNQLGKFISKNSPYNNDRTTSVWYTNESNMIKRFETREEAEQYIVSDQYSGYQIVEIDTMSTKTTSTAYVILNKTTGKYVKNIGSNAEDGPAWWEEAKNFPPKYSTSETKEGGRNMLAAYQARIQESIDHYGPDFVDTTSGLWRDHFNKLYTRMKAANLILVKVTRTYTEEVEEVDI